MGTGQGPLSRCGFGLLACALFGFYGAGPGVADSSGDPGPTLTYVKSSVGLRPPAWEEGDTELEMADVNGDGHVDIVSVGDVNDDGHADVGYGFHHDWCFGDTVDPEIGDDLLEVALGDGSG